MALNLLVLLLFVPLNVAFERINSSPIDADFALLEKICNQASDKSFCFSTLVGDPRTRSADLHGLALISVSLTVIQVQEAASQIPGLLRTVTDPVGKQRLHACLSDYEAALEKFEGAYRSATAKSYWEVINWVRDGANEVIDCQNIYRRDPISESPISGDNLKVVRFSEIILIVIDMLLP